MLKSKYINLLVITLILIGLALILKFGYIDNKVDTRYVEMLFDDTKVHTIDLRPSNDMWQELINNADEKNYMPCDIIIDGEEFKGVGLRAKGGTSLYQIQKKEDSDRYSLKIKFNKYNRNYTYYGLDELILNNVISDTTYLKEYLVYDMMQVNGVASPYTSFIQVKLNGEDFGLYMGIEGLDKSFLERNYGKNYGNLYKPKDLNKRNKEPDYSRNFGTDLVYTTDDFYEYKGIFKNSKTNSDDTDKIRLINSLKNINESKDLEKYIDIDKTLRYFVVHNFVDSYDSYTSDILNNYLLYEDNGKLSMLPWDYNLAFGGYGGIPDEYYKIYGDKSEDVGEERGDWEEDVREDWSDTEKYSKTFRLVNLSIDEPLILVDEFWEDGTPEFKRPMWENLMVEQKYYDVYHEIFREFIDNYIKSGYFERKFNKAVKLIDSYVKNDKSSFYTYEEHLLGVETLKKFILLRAQSVDNQLNKVYENVKVDKLDIDDLGLPYIIPNWIMYPEEFTEDDIEYLEQLENEKEKEKEARLEKYYSTD